MTITKKKEIEEIIQKGSESKFAIDEKKTYVFVSQKIRLDIMEKIKKAVEDRPGMNRTAWIQEAISEKLGRLNND